MTANRSVGTFLIVGGVVLVVLGALFRAGLLGWFGHLPGDIRVEREGTRVFVPLVSMLVISVALNVVLYVVRRFLGG